jgi:hypothetical protein
MALYGRTDAGRTGRVAVGGRRGVRVGERLSLREAAEVLGVSKDAVRQRVRRDTIRSERGEDGRVYVYLDESSEAATDGKLSDTVPQSSDRTAELISTLREQVQAERQAHAETRRLLAAALERIPPQLEAPQDGSESAQPRSGTPTPAEASEGAQKPAQRERSWWERWFGG